MGYNSLAVESSFLHATSGHKLSARTFMCRVGVIDCNLDKEDGESSESGSEPSAGRKHSPDGNAQKKGAEEEEENKEDAKEEKDATAAVSELAKLAKEANINISKAVTPSPEKEKESPEKKENEKPKSKAFG